MKRGTILFHSKFRFHNGEIGEKFLVILNNQKSRDPFLVAKTTAQDNNKSRNPGCILKENLFFIEVSKTWFKLDTWVQLFEVYPFTASEVLKARFDGDLEIRGELPEQKANEIKNCVKRLIDFPVRYKEMIVKK
ncbi:MAG: hypothetical protein U9N83_06860 [Thermodesulfobacteriota bacterium]|nr:hypothetical protein [Thermodesulfobacteriota bacterium]